jgi:LemA protein
VSNAMIIFAVIAAVIVLILLIAGFFVVMYNGLVRSRNFVDNAGGQIDVQLKRRYDLIPNLVETVKGYASHEKELLENVTKARAAVMSATSVAGKAEASNMLSSTLKSLFAVAENYPNLKANENFMDLQRQLKDTEDKIAYTRQFYNDAVTKYNTEIQTIPRNIVAGLFGFTKKELFEAEADAREVPKVKF